MRLTERRENGGKRKWRQIRQENFKREIREKGKTPKRKRDIAGSVEPGKPPARKYDFSFSLANSTTASSAVGAKQNVPLFDSVISIVPSLI